MWELLWQKFLAVGCLNRQVPGKHVMAGDLIRIQDMIKIEYLVQKIYKNVPTNKSKINLILAF